MSLCSFFFPWQLKSVADITWLIKKICSKFKNLFVYAKFSRCLLWFNKPRKPSKKTLAFLGYNNLENLVVLLLVFLYISFDFWIDNPPSKQSPKNATSNSYVLTLWSQIPSIPLHISSYFSLPYHKQNQFCREVQQIFMTLEPLITSFPLTNMYQIL